MLDRVVDLLAPALDEPGAVVVDATLGLGGHAGALLRRCPRDRWWGRPRSRRWTTHASDWPRSGHGWKAVHAVYDELPTVLAASRWTE